MFPREDSAPGFHANATSATQHRGCRGTCHQISRWEEESRSKGTGKAAPMTGASNIISKAQATPLPLAKMLTFQGRHPPVYVGEDAPIHPNPTDGCVHHTLRLQPTMLPSSR